VNEFGGFMTTRRRRTLSIFLTMIFLMISLYAASYFIPQFAFLKPLLELPLLAIFLLDNVGVPWLLASNGLCGSGWCGPTVFGWLLVSSIWLIFIWLISWAFSKKFRKNS